MKGGTGTGNNSITKAPPPPPPSCPALPALDIDLPPPPSPIYPASSTQITRRYLHALPVMAVRTSPAGYGFTALRMLQLLVLFSILPLLSNFMISLDRLDAIPPYQLLFTLIMSLAGVAYFLSTAIMHMLGRGNSYTTFVLLDGVFLVLFIVAAVILGAPLSGLDCGEVAEKGHHISSLMLIRYDGDGNGTSRFDAEHFGALQIGGLDLPAVGDSYADGQQSAGNYEQWIGRVGGICRQMKGAWAGAMALDVLLAGSIVAAYLIRRSVRKLPEFEDDEGDEVGFAMPAAAADTPRLDGGEGEPLNGRDGAGRSQWGGSDRPDSAGGSDRPDSRGESERPDSRGESERPDSVAGNKCPSALSAV